MMAKEEVQGKREGAGKLAVLLGVCAVCWCCACVRIGGWFDVAISAVQAADGRMFAYHHVLTGVLVTV